MNSGLASKILVNKAGAIGPEAKLLLLRFVAVSGEGPVRATTRDLARRFGIALNVISRATSELAEAGFVVRRPVVDGRGRPAYEYEVMPGAIESLKRECPPETPSHWSLIELLLMEQVCQAPASREGDTAELSDDSSANVDAASTLKSTPSRPSRKGAGATLSSANRMLLLVLLAHADRMGVVQGIGGTELAALAGLASGRLATQVEKLVGLGLVRSVVNGVTGDKLLGKVPSAYVLNLQHSAYGRARVEGVLYLLEAAVHAGQPIPDREGPQLYAVANRWHLLELNFSIRMPPWGATPSPPDLHRFGVMQQIAELLDGRGSPGLAAFLQFRIETYASYFLSTRWSLLFSPQDELLMEPDYALRARIVRDLVPARIYRKGWPGEDVLMRYRVLVEVVYVVSLRLAETVRHTIHKTPLPSKMSPCPKPEKMNYLLLPATEAGGAVYFAVLACPKVASSMNGNAFCVRPEFGKIRNRVWPDGRLAESEYTFDEQCQWGLRTRSRKERARMSRANLNTSGLISHV